MGKAWRSVFMRNHCSLDRNDCAEHSENRKEGAGEGAPGIAQKRNQIVADLKVNQNRALTAFNKASKRFNVSLSSVVGGLLANSDATR